MVTLWYGENPGTNSVEGIPTIEAEITEAWILVLTVPQCNSLNCRLQKTKPSVFCVLRAEHFAEVRIFSWNQNRLFDVIGFNLADMNSVLRSIRDSLLVGLTD